MSDTLVHIAGIRKDYLLQHLVNYASSDKSLPPVTLEEARTHLAARSKASIFVAMRGRMLGVCLTGDTMDTTSYDTYNGAGQGRKAAYAARIAQDTDYREQRRKGVALPTRRTVAPVIDAINAYAEAIDPAERPATLLDEAAQLIADLMKLHCDPVELLEAARSLYDEQMGPDILDQSRWTERWITQLFLQRDKAAEDAKAAHPGRLGHDSVVHARLAAYRAHDALVEAESYADAIDVERYNTSLDLTSPISPENPE